MMPLTKEIFAKAVIEKIEGTENAHGAYIIAPKVEKEETAQFMRHSKSILSK